MTIKSDSFALREAFQTPEALSVKNIVRLPSWTETTQVAMVTTRRLIMAGALALVELHHAAGIRCLDRITRRNYKEFGQKMICKPDVSKHSIMYNRYIDMHLNIIIRTNTELAKI